jgi:hypothetical protein
MRKKTKLISYIITVLILVSGILLFQTLTLLSVILIILSIIIFVFIHNKPLIIGDEIDVLITESNYGFNIKIDGNHTNKTLYFISVIPKVEGELKSGEKIEDIFYTNDHNMLDSNRTEELIFLPYSVTNKKMMTAAPIEFKYSSIIKRYADSEFISKPIYSITVIVGTINTIIKKFDYTLKNEITNVKDEGNQTKLNCTLKIIDIILNIIGSNQITTRDYKKIEVAAIMFSDNKNEPLEYYSKVKDEPRSVSTEKLTNELIKNYYTLKMLDEILVLFISFAIVDGKKDKIRLKEILKVFKAIDADIDELNELYDSAVSIDKMIK